MRVSAQTDSYDKHSASDTPSLLYTLRLSLPVQHYMKPMLSSLYDRPLICSCQPAAARRCLNAAMAGEVR